MKPHRPLLSRAVVVLCLGLALLVLGAGVGHASWTVMVYLCADNDLEGAGIDDINEMERVGSRAGLNILVQFDRTAGYDSSNGDWTGAHRYYVTQDSSTSTIGSTLLQDLGEVNMGDPAVLTSFATWCTANYPADDYLLVIWDHGDGWRKAPSPRAVKGVAYDDTNGDYLTVQEVRESLSQIKAALGRNLDVLAYDACLMQMLEVAYEVRDLVNYQVGSAEVVPWDGLPYDDFLGRLAANTSMAPAQVCQALVQTYCASYDGGSQGRESVTFSGVSLSALGALATAVDALSVVLKDGMASGCPEILTCQTAAQTYADWDYRDLYHFALLLLENVSDAAIQAAAAEVLSALDAAVIVNGRVGEWTANAHGLSIYYPLAEYYDATYRYLMFASATRWNDHISAPRPCSSIILDAYEPDDTAAQASTATVGYTQPLHWMHQPGDQDWVKFEGETGLIYGIGTKNLGMWADTYIYLYAGDGTTLLAADDDSGPGAASLIEYSCWWSGTYYVQIAHYYPDLFGLETRYDFFVKRRWFPDISFYHWAWEQIGACAQAGLVAGYPDGNYQPSLPVDRGQMAVFIARAMAGGDAGVPEGPPDPTFTDVPVGYWAYRYIEYAADRDIVRGYGDGTYHPEFGVNRGQMAVFMARGIAGGDAGVPEPTGDPTFSDVTPATAWEWCHKYVEYIAARGITRGYSDGLYHPEYTCSRDQMAVFLTRAFELPM